MITYLLYSCGFTPPFNNIFPLKKLHLSLFCGMEIKCEILSLHATFVYLLTFSSFAWRKFLLSSHMLFEVVLRSLFSYLTMVLICHIFSFLMMFSCPFRLRSIKLELLSPSLTYLAVIEI